MLPRGNNGPASHGRSSISSPCSLCNPMTSLGLQSEQRLGSEHLPRELCWAYCLPLGCWHIPLGCNASLIPRELGLGWAYCLPLGCNASLLHNSRSAKALVQYHYNTVSNCIKTFTSYTTQLHNCHLQDILLYYSIAGRRTQINKKWCP